jgi:hypothetical protein
MLGKCCTTELHPSLGHLINKGKHRLGSKWVEGITGMPLPKTKRECQKFLGKIGYCRLWIEFYAFKTKVLYSKLLEEEHKPLLCKLNEVHVVEILKHSLITIPVLALSSLKKSFLLFVNMDKGAALGILTQEHGGKKQLIIYLT